MRLSLRFWATIRLPTPVKDLSHLSSQQNAAYTTKMLPTTLVLQLLLAISGVCLAAPSEYHMYPRVMVPQAHLEVLKLRRSTAANPAAVTDTTCLDANK